MQKKMTKAVITYAAKTMLITQIKDQHNLYIFERKEIEVYQGQ